MVAIPTETVYGLAGNIYNEGAIKRIFEVKKRPLFNPLIVHVHSIEQVESITIEFPEKARKLADHFWPGAITLVLKKNEVIPDLITAGKDTVAVRIPNHPVTLDLLRILPFPLAAPSANPFNRISPTQAQHVASYFEDDVPMVLDGGPCNRGLESTIIGFKKDEPIVYRLGAISLENIEQVVGKVQVMNKKEKTPDAPGMLKKHYSPRTKTIVVDNVRQYVQQHQELQIAVLSFSDAYKSLKVKHVEILSKERDFKKAAAGLYQALHKLDDLKIDLIVAERFPMEDLGRAINDRLNRASQ